MTTAAKPRTSPTWSRRDLLEQVTAAGSPLKVDEEKGVIYRVKVLGRFSRNNHGLTEAENGSEYSPACMRSALPMYEGSKVKANHPPDRTRPAAERDVDDTFGVLRNCVVESDERGEPAIWGDLHFLKTHRLAPSVVEDVKRGLGVYGLSHNAAARRERFDRGSRRLVIEELAVVRSVDLVDKPATNRNLWESEEKHVAKITLRDLLESQRKRFSTNRLSWMDRLLEDDAMGYPMRAEQDAMPAETDPDQALKGGFDAACMAVINNADMTADEKVAKLKELLKTHEKLTQKAEPEAAESEGEGDDKDKDKDKDKQESEEVKGLKAENAKLKAEQKARELCEAEGFATATKTQLKALVLLESDAERKELIATWKGGKPALKTPKSTPPGGNPGGGKDKDKQNRDLAESEKAEAVGESMRTLRG